MHHFQQNITKEDINLLELDHYRGELLVIDNKEGIQAAFDHINEFAYVGFDTESKPAFKKGTYNPIALIQISTPEKTFLFRINRTGITEIMKAFLENKDIAKIGIGLGEDIRDLNKLGVHHPKGFIQFNEVVKSIDIESNGLRKLAAIILGFRVSKSCQVSNWEASTLTQKQLLYAATDSWVCLEMYQKLIDLELIEHLK